MGWVWVRGRGGDGRLVNAGLLPGGHETGQVVRVGEEGKDELVGVGEPLLGLVGVLHALVIVRWA